MVVCQVIYFQLKILKNKYMAEGGGEFSYEDPNLDHDIDHDSDEEVVNPNDYDDDAVQEQLNTTQPFRPGQASTPYHAGEQWEMQTMQEEHAGLPDTSYAETPLLGGQQQQSWDALTRLFPNASATNLETSYSMKGRLQVKFAGAGKKLYDLFTKNRSGQQQMNPKLSLEIKKSLGTMAEQIIAEDRDTIQEQRHSPLAFKMADEMLGKNEQIRMYVG